MHCRGNGRVSEDGRPNHNWRRLKRTLQHPNVNHSRVSRCSTQMSITQGCHAAAVRSSAGCSAVWWPEAQAARTPVLVRSGPQAPSSTRASCPPLRPPLTESLAPRSTAAPGVVVVVVVVVPWWRGARVCSCVQSWAAPVMSSVQLDAPTCL